MFSEAKMDYFSKKKITRIILPLWITIFFIADSAAAASPAQHVDLYFPTPVLEGQDITMNCRFIVDKNSSIYQVKWYKGSREIFRYTQKESPPKKTFPLQHIVVDEKQSDMNKLVLRKVPLGLRGNVSCEVTWEPSFNTVTRTSEIVVVSPPTQRPSLTVEFYPPTKSFSRSGVETIHVKTGDMLTANCTSGPSIPAPNVTMFINDDNSNLMKNQGLTQDIIVLENKTEIRTVSLKLLLRFTHFDRHKIRVRCEATLFNLYNSSSDQYEAELHHRESVIQPSSYGLGRNGAVGCGSSFLGKLLWFLLSVKVMELVLIQTRWTSNAGL